jgi:hypothetical protein
MSDLKKYVVERKRRDREFAKGFDEGNAQFKIGATLRSPKVGVCIQISLGKYSNQGCGLGLSCDQAAGNLSGDFQLAF